MISAMTIALLIIVTTAIVLVSLSVRAALHDGRGLQPPPASHYQDPGFLPPARNL